MYKKSDAISNIFPKKKDVASGMHVPSGENMWAYPVDDDMIDNEAEEKDIMLKSAVGLTSIPGEQQKDYQFEQPMHIKDPINIGIIDVDTVVDMPPINYCGDKEMRKEKLEDIFLELKNEEINKTAQAFPAVSLISQFGTKSPKVSKPWKQYTDDRFFEQQKEWESGTLKSINNFLSIANKEYVKNLAYSGATILVGVPAFTTSTKLALISSIYKNVSNFDFIYSNVEWAKTKLQGINTWVKSKSNLLPQSIINAWNKTSYDISQFLQLKETETKFDNAPEPQVYKPTITAPRQAPIYSKEQDWNKYIGEDRAKANLYRTWQEQTPAGYDKSYNSFTAWYNNKKQQLGRDFNPEEAVRFIEAENMINRNPSVSGTGTVGEASKPGVGTTSTIESYVTTESVVNSLKRLINGMPLMSADAGGTPAKIDSSKASRMTKRYLRQLRNISPTPSDVASVVNYAATDIVNRILSNPAYAEELNTIQDPIRKQQYFDGCVWQELRNLNAERGSFTGGKDRPDKAADRRKERMKRRLRRRI